MTKNRKPHIIFHSYNPYEARYPGLRVISREMLHLIKVLRDQGYNVIVEPDNGNSLYYLAEKGLREFLSDPVIVLVIGIPLNFLLNLISNWVYDRLKRKPRADDEVNLILEYDENGHKARYDHSGQQITDEQFLAIQHLLNERSRLFKESLSVVPPEPSRPYPIYLEHNPRIIGWAEKIVIDNNGLRVEGIKIFDQKTLMRIENNDLKGFSIGGIIRKSICSICNHDYVECNHLTGRKYNGEECVVRIDDILLADLSIVKKPVQPMAHLEKTYKEK
jgi:hypothetical protein